MSKDVSEQGEKHTEGWNGPHVRDGITGVDFFCQPNPTRYSKFYQLSKESFKKL